jgi:multidrug resistance efflux pump
MPDPKQANFEHQPKLLAILNNSGAPNLITLVAASGLLFASGTLWLQLTRVRAREAIVEVRTLTLNAPIEGVISTLNVQAGERVQKGDLLFQISNPRVAKPRIGDLQLELSAAQAKLQLLQSQEARAEKILSVADKDFTRQSKLQAARHKEELYALIQKRSQSEQEASFAERNFARRNKLYNQGAIAFDEVDRAESILTQAREEIRMNENRIRAQQKILEAAEYNLTLIATRGGADPETFLRQSKLGLEAIREEKKAQHYRMQELQKQLSRAIKEYEIKRIATVISPINGVTWTINRNAGSSVKEQDTVLSLLDCSDRWVNTYVREGDIKNLRMGQKAEIILYGAKHKLVGEISLIRSGIGRSSIGRDIIPLLPINMYREAQVKISIVNNKNLSSNPNYLCYSGYTGKVIFQP